MLLFSYGSIVVPSITQRVFDAWFEPLQSVFIKGYKLELKHAQSKKNPNYHYIICTPTDNQEDLIPGFLVNIPEDLVERLNKWEGDSYKLEEIVCYTRELKEIKCFMYIENDQ